MSITGKRIAHTPLTVAPITSLASGLPRRSGGMLSRFAVIDSVTAMAAHSIRPGTMPPATNSLPMETCPTVP